MRRGRKATGLKEIAGLPGCQMESRVTLESRVARLFGLMGAVLTKNQKATGGDFNGILRIIGFNRHSWNCWYYLLNYCEEDCLVGGG